MNLWWLNPGAALRWSAEERGARMAIYGLTIPFFLVFFLPAVALFWFLGADNHISVLISLPTVTASIFCGRLLSDRLWPDLLKTADANATKRLSQRQH